jgi:hypothetical protein
MVMKRLLAAALGITRADEAKALVEHDARPTRAQELEMGYYAKADLSQGFLPYVDYKAPHANRPTPRRPHLGRPARLDFAGSAFPGRLFKGHRP